MKKFFEEYKLEQKIKSKAEEIGKRKGLSEEEVKKLAKEYLSIAKNNKAN